MEAANEVVGWLGFASWSLLAVVALRVLRKRRDDAARWLALTFGTLAAVVIVARLIPRDVTIDPPALLIKVLLAGIVLFAYFLYRFVFSFITSPRWEQNLVAGLTIVVIAAGLAIPRIPRPGDPRPWWMLAFTVLLIVQWGAIMARVATHLWTKSRGQPAVARRRMTTMGAGAAGLIGSLLIGAFFPAASTKPGVAQVVSGVISLATGPLFLLGFAPPRIVRVLWRQKEEAAIRRMEIGLASAVTRSEIAASFVPRIAALLGGRGAALVDRDGVIVGQHELSEEDATSLVWKLPVDAELYVPVEVESARVLKMENGCLVVTVGPFTPFFGTDELQMLSVSAVVADLALGRATLFELERQSREAMRDFVAIASHDLRTPVTVIQGFIQLLDDSWESIDESERRQYVAAITRQVTHLDRLISDLLTVSKLDVGEIAVFGEQLEMNDVVVDAVKSVAGDIDIDVHRNGRAPVFADPEHVVRMLQIYISNARVYGEPPYSVDVATTEDSVVVRVRDSGPGIPEAFVPHLFEKFARVDKKKSKAARGTGLGLSIVRGLARANGGDAWYEPNAPRGACFAIRLPLVRARLDEKLNA